MKYQCITQMDLADKLKLRLSAQMAPKYYIHNQEDMETVTRLCGNAFQYDFLANQHSITKKLFIAPIAALNGQFGVFADEEIQPSTKTLGFYNGKRIRRLSNPDSLHVFQISDNDENVIGYIDANKRRDWTAFINHSPLANLYVKQRRSQGEVNVYFYVDTAIKQHHQLMFDYGDEYFSNAGIKSFYMHASDNWLMPDDLYQKNQVYYHSGLFDFEQSVKTDLNLADVYWVLPQLAYAVIQHDVKRVAKLLQQRHPVDLLAYAIDKNEYTFSPFSQQQHLTPLMLACYLGYQDCIDLLLKHGAECDRCMLVSGYNSLALLLLGHAEQTVIDAVALKLLDDIEHPFVCDHLGLGLLHYAIVRNNVKLVKALLNIAEDSAVDILVPMFNRDDDLPAYADFDYCIMRGQFAILKLLLEKVVDSNTLLYGEFDEAVKVGWLFRKETFLQASNENLHALKTLLLKFKPKKRRNLAVIKQLIKRVSLV